MSCPQVIKVITPGPPGAPGGAITMTGPAVIGRASGTGAAAVLPLGFGLAIVDGVMVVTATGATDLSYDPSTRLLSSSTGADVTLPLAGTTAGLLSGVAFTGPAGWTAGASITAGGITLSLALPAGSTLVSSGDRLAWNAAFNDRMYWDGSSTQLNAATGRASLELGSAARLDAPVTGDASYGQVVTGGDSRLSNAREWSAATATQAEAEAGASTSRLAFTPQRVFQAIAAWWAASSAKAKLDGIAAGATANATDAQLRDRSTHTGTQAASTISDSTATGRALLTGALQSANLIFAGPASGAAAAPTFRSLVAADLPAAYATAGAIGSSGLTMATAQLLGRSTAGTGAPEEITIGSNLTLSGGVLSAAAGTPGGSSGQVQFNNAGAFGGISTLTTDGSGNLTLTGRLTNAFSSLASAPAKLFSGTWFTGGTSTTTKPHVLIEPTGTTSTAWSTGGTGLGVNAASGFAGNLLDLQVNGTSYLKMSSTSGQTGGTLTLRAGGTGAATIALSVQNSPGTETATITASGNINGLQGTFSNAVVANALVVDVSNQDVSLRRDAAGTLAQRNGTNAQTFRLYNTTDAGLTNFERGFMRWNTNVLQVGTEKGGTGSARSLELQTDGTTRLTVAANGATISAASGTALAADHRLTGTAPASATATGTAGDIRYDADYIYICTATNTWKRAALSTW